MTIRDLLAADRPTLSYELFPPRSPAAQEALPATMAMLARTHPDFMSITYGAS
ncbi:MAG: methylenetetrahydrofolate reductase, partial [Demequinaceae bacterium]|nr:methylenetetrahydrofolate reductase [Demequinaceae bacterium]